MTYFKLFALAPSVDLDVPTLEARYRALSLETHPDRLTQADARTRRLAAEKSAALNEGFRILKDPERRAMYLLSLKGITLDTEQAAAQLKMPLAFLEEVMEQRERLDQLKRSRSIEPALEMAERIRSQRASCLQQAQQALRGNDVASAALALGRVRYYARFLEEVDAFEEECLS